MEMVLREVVEAGHRLPWGPGVGQTAAGLGRRRRQLHR